MSDINESVIEAPLKCLLEEVTCPTIQVLFFLENFIEDQNDLKIVEQQLKDYDNLQGLVKIISNVFKTLTKKVEKKINYLKLNINDSKSSYRPEEEYEKLEQIIQKHEAEIRGHISLEQQLKLCNESLQQKIEDIEKQHKEEKETLSKQINLSIIGLKRRTQNSHPYRRRSQNEGKKFCHSDHRQKKVDYSSEYPTSMANFYPQNSMRHSTPLKSQSQHHKSGKISNRDQDLFSKYNQLLKQHAQSITQRSQIIQASQYLLKGGFLNNNKKSRNTLNVISDLCNSQQQKTRNKSQGNSKTGTSNPCTKNNTTQKIISDTSKANEAIQRLLKLK